MKLKKGEREAEVLTVGRGRGEIIGGYLQRRRQDGQEDQAQLHHGERNGREA